MMMASLLAGCGSTPDAPAATQAPTEPATEVPAEAATEAPAADDGVRTADPNKPKIVFGITASFEHFTSYIPEMMAEIPEGSLYTTFDIIENPKNRKLVEMDMFSRYSALNGDVDLAMSVYTNSAQERYGFNLLKLFDENVAFPQVIAVRNEDKDTQWVKDFVDAFTSQTQIDKINEKNIPNLAWKILFVASDAK